MSEPASSTCIACKAEPNASYARFVSKINGRVGYVCSPECKEQLVGVVYGVVDASKPNRVTVYTIMPDLGDYSPIFVQGDAPNQWHSATREQKKSIWAWIDRVGTTNDHAYVHTDAYYQVVTGYITSLNGDKKPRRWIQNAPYGMADAHDGA